MSQEKRVGVGVAVFVVRENGTFIMGKRQNAHGHNSWTVPGGWLEFGESWEDAAIREVAEETGLKIGKPIVHLATTNDYFEDEGVHSNTIWLRAEYLGGEPRILEPDKFLEQGWYSLDNLPDPLFLPWSNLLQNSISLDPES